MTGQQNASWEISKGKTFLGTLARSLLSLTNTPTTLLRVSEVIYTHKSSIKVSGWHYWEAEVREINLSSAGNSHC